MRSSELGGTVFDASWQKVCHETKLEGESITKKAHLEAMWKSFGKTALFATISLQKKATMRFTMEHKCQIFSSSWTSLLDAWLFSAAEGDLLLDFKSSKTGRWAMVCPIDSVLARIRQAKASVFSDPVWCLGRQAMSKPSGKLEDSWIDNCKEGG